MKTTIDIPDSLYPELAAASSAEGVSVEAYVVEATKQKLGGANGTAKPHEVCPNPLPQDHPLAAFWAHQDGLSESKRRTLHGAVEEVQSIIDEEFSQVDPQDWE